MQAKWEAHRPMLGVGRCRGTPWGTCCPPQSRQQRLCSHDYNLNLHHNSENHMTRQDIVVYIVHTIHWMLVVTSSITKPQIQNKSHKPTKSYQITRRRDSVRDWSALTRNCQRQLPKRPTQGKQTYKSQGGTTNSGTACATRHDRGNDVSVGMTTTRPYIIMQKNHKIMTIQDIVVYIPFIECLL